MSLIRAAAATFLLLVMVVACMRAQTRVDTLITARGDTITSIWPPPDSTFAPGTIILKFGGDVVNWSELCYQEECNSIGEVDTAFLASILTERFAVADVVADAAIRTTLIAHGYDSLQRMSMASPCLDQLTLTISGDTIACDDWRWLVAIGIRDTDDVALVEELRSIGGEDGRILIADLNYYVQSMGTPGSIEEMYHNGFQWGLTSTGPGGISIERAWDFTSGGSRACAIGIIDDGIDYGTCELGDGAFGVNAKVCGGWDFWTNTPHGISMAARHGTCMAGIAAQLTNNYGCTDPPHWSGVAGVAGGWGSNALGPRLYGWKINDKRKWDSDNVNDAILQNVEQAILDASRRRVVLGGLGCNQTVFLQQVHVLYVPWTQGHAITSICEAVAIAHERGLTVVSVKGHYLPETPARGPAFPADYDPQAVISVGSAEEDGTRVLGSENRMQAGYGFGMDLLAPGRGCAPAYGRRYDVWDADVIIWNSAAGPLPPAGTCNAAAHVTGVAALVWSVALDSSWQWPGGSRLRPEDVEAVLKIAATDVGSEVTNYLDGYDEESGWGDLNAGHLFDLLNQGYRIWHIDADPGAFTAGPWQSLDNMVNYRGKRLLPYRREISGDVQLPAYMMADGPFYAWGVSGGLSLASPYNTGADYCLVTGLEGNASADQKTPGLKIQDNVTSVHVQAYQYMDLVGQLYPAVPQFRIGMFGRPLDDRILNADPYSNGESTGLTIARSGEIMIVSVRAATSEVRMTVHDVLGRSFTPVFTAHRTADIAQLRCNTSGWPQGSYIVSVCTSTGLHSRAIAIVR